MKITMATIAALCFIALAACKKDDTKPGSDNTFTVTVDSTKFTSSASDFLIYIDTLTGRQTPSGADNFAYDLTGPMGGGQLVEVVMNTTSGKLTTGAYTNIADENNQVFWRANPTDPAYYLAVPKYTTTVNVTRSDSAFLEGNFSGTLAYSTDTSKKVSVTGGQFKVNLKTAIIGRSRR